MSGDLTSTPYNTLDSDPLDAASSLESRSQPLNIALSTSDLFTGDGRTMKVLSVMSQIQRQLSAASSVQDLLDIIVEVVHELTAFHRCMIYQFDQSFNGKVVAELVNPHASSDFYKDLHFRATEISKQARELHKIDKVRALFDRDRKPVRLAC